MKSVASRLLTLGIVALSAAFMIGEAVADPATADPPFAARILDAVGALQTAVNGLQSTVNNVQANTRGIQSNLGEIQPTWDQILPADVRFVPALDGAAILDLETGLVWEKSPAAQISVFLWAFAQVGCNASIVGGRSGWHLPTIQELQSLVDPTVAGSGRKLPPGHPFTSVAGEYWSATSGNNGSNDKDIAWVASFTTGFPHEIEKDQQSSLSAPRAWCVRGGQGTDRQ